MKPKAFFVAATGQNVGKTTTCLGLVSGLKKRYDSIGFMKPVGQEHIETETGVHVDKDVVLFKNHFELKDPYEAMSPVLFPRGFTRDYLDGKVSHDDLVRKIEESYKELTKRNDWTVIEGTGHIGVGSIVELNNAQVAHLLHASVILVASGGLGSSFDELALNWTMCRQHGVSVAGVILNRVLEEKREMVIEYMTRALDRWKVPLLGCIPFNTFLSTPSMQDFELLFDTKVLSGAELRMLHFDHIRLFASTVEMVRTLVPNQLIITPANREDMILTMLTRYWDFKIAHPEQELHTGMILTGRHPPKDSIVEQIKRAKIPMLYVPVSSFVALKMINTFTAKIRKEDVAKVKEAIQVVETHVDFDRLIHALSER